MKSYPFRKLSAFEIWGRYQDAPEPDLEPDDDDDYDDRTAGVDVRETL